MKKAMILWMALGVSACVSLSQNGANVKVVDTLDEVPGDCTEVGYQEAASADEVFASALAAAEIELRNRAAEHGANLIRITKKRAEVLPLSGAVMGGMTYACQGFKGS